ncbi:MAG: YigZ family protein [Oscillospiraceae bacterium]|nr:YigZ family protein [Oscillospiraceae bacterium]
MNNYKTPKIRANASFTERKSEFIGHICPVSSEKEALDFLAEIRAENRKATHNCYAYILKENNISRYSDDGEPSGTAGVVILDALQKEGLTNVMCVVTRYFGGILLGAGGLVRAYSKAASIAVSQAGIKTMLLARKVLITLDYPLYGKVEKIFSREYIHFPVKKTGTDTRVFLSVVKRDFGKEVKLTVFIEERETAADKFTDYLNDLCNGAVVVNFIQNEFFDFG